VVAALVSGHIIQASSRYTDDFLAQIQKSLVCNGYHRQCRALQGIDETHPYKYGRLSKQARIFGYFLGKTSETVTYSRRWTHTLIMGRCGTIEHRKSKSFHYDGQIAAEEARWEGVKPLLISFSSELSAEIAMSCVHLFHSFVPSVSN
jgi:hypothetical protein